MDTIAPEASAPLSVNYTLTKIPYQNTANLLFDNETRSNGMITSYYYTGQENAQ